MAAAREREEDAVTNILPGLPDDVGLRCLALLPRSQHAKLRSVCTRWRDLVTKGLTSFHALRSTMGLTQYYLVLLSCGYPYEVLIFSEINLSSATPSLRHVHFRRTDYDASVDENGKWEFHACGPAYIPIGPFVLMLGGRNMLRPRLYDRLHIFDISSGFWRLGASMPSPRQMFAWGVINNRLYVAGGFVVEDCSTLTKRTDVYDFDSDRWSRVANMPLFLSVNFYYVHKEALYIGGLVGGGHYEKEGSAQKLYSYLPSEDQWKEEERHPDTIFHDTTTSDVVKEFTVIQDGGFERLFMLDIQLDADNEESDTEDYHTSRICRDVMVLKLEEKTSEWNAVYHAEEWVVDGECGCLGRCFVDFLSLGKKPVVLVHGDHNDEEPDAAAHTLQTRDEVVELSSLKEVLKISVKCPFLWKALVINA